MPDTPQVLIPYDKREALTLQQAAGIAGRSPETIRRWCALEDIGRRVGGRWAVSHPALLMWLDGDAAALRAYHAGERQGDCVTAYFDRAGLCAGTHSDRKPTGGFPDLGNNGRGSGNVSRS